MSAPKEKALSALEKIRRQRRGEAKATEQYEVRDENAEIFETVSEEKYSEIKQQRKASQWIEGDDGEEGYSDDGEEWWASGSDEQNSPRAEARRKRRLEKSASGKSVSSKRAAADARAQGMRSLLQHFSSMAASDSARNSGAQRADGEGGSGAAAHLQKLQSLEAALNLDDDAFDENPQPNTKKPSASAAAADAPSQKTSFSEAVCTPAAPPRCRGPLVSAGCTDSTGLGVFGFRRRGGPSATARNSQLSGNFRETPPARRAAETECTYSAKEETAFSPAAREGVVAESAEDFANLGEADADSAASEASDGEENSAAAQAQSVFFDGVQQKSEFCASRSAARLKKSLGDGREGCWVFGDAEEEACEAQKEEPLQQPALGSEGGFARSASSSDSSLPACEDGSLPFFVLDAFDDPATGSVYLFGKVWAAAAASPGKGGSAPPESCCVVVQEMERPLFFFLRKQVAFDPTPEELAAFEAEALSKEGPSVEASIEAFRASRVQERQQNAKEFVLTEGRRLKEKYKWKRMRVKAVSRNYAFDAPGMPRGVDLQFVKVLVPGASPALSSEDCSGVTYSHVFGVGAPLSETLLVKRGIKGPTWVKVEGFSLPASASEKHSWCRHEVRVNSHKQIRAWGSRPKARADAQQPSDVGQEEGVSREEEKDKDGQTPPPPPLCVVALSVKPLLAPGAPDDGGVAVASLFLLPNSEVDNPLQRPSLTPQNSFCAVRRLRPNGRAKFANCQSVEGAAPLGGPACPRAIASGLPPAFEEHGKRNGVCVFDSEAQLLLALLSRVNAFDPDVLMGHDCFGESLQLLGARLHALNLPLWHRLSRLKRAKAVRVPVAGGVLGGKGSGGLGSLRAGRLLTVGRLVCDTYLQAKEIVGHRSNYDLDSLLKELLPPPPAKAASAGSPSAYEARLRAEVMRLIPFPAEDLISLFHSARVDGLLAASGIVRREAFLSVILALRLNCLSISKELACVSGAPWMLSLQNKRAERNAFLLMHVFHGDKFVYPDPPASGPGFGRRRERASREEVAGEEDGFEEDAEAGGDGGGGETRASSFAARGRVRGKAAYAGGLVLEPRVGLYDSFVLLLDFNSLYPSIIQEFNVCFSTVRRPQVSAAGVESSVEGTDGGEDAAEAVLGIDATPGVLPRILRSLVERRRQVKALMGREKDEARKQQLHALQLAVKLTANSIYGCLGFSGSRFSSKTLAAFITRKGREMLGQAKEKAERDLGLSVIYGDTDSIMVSSAPPGVAMRQGLFSPPPRLSPSLRRVYVQVDTGMRDDGSGSAFAEAEKVGLRLKKEINKKYRCLEIDLEAIFARLLLLKKKKYACSIVKDFAKKEFVIQLKGLDFVRRDWALMTKQAGHQLLNIIFSGASSGPRERGGGAVSSQEKNGEENSVDSVVARLHERLTAMKEAVLGGSLPLELFVITKGLTKAPEAYAQGTAPQPHVAVALRLLKAGKGVRAGMEIPYVICSEESIAEAEQRRASPHALGEKAKDASSKQNPPSAHRSAAERAFHPLEVVGLGLKPDLQYYLSQQLFPPIERLCAFVQGTSPARIAECLGLDPLKVARNATVSGVAADDSDADAETQRGEDRILALVKKGEEAFKGIAIPVHAPCGGCGNWTPATEAFKTLECQSCHAPLSPSALRCLLFLFLSHLRLAFHSHRSKCSECLLVFDSLPPQPLSEGPPLRCPRCETGRLADAFPARELYRHLQHLQFRLSSGPAGASSGAPLPLSRELVWSRVSLDGNNAAVAREAASSNKGAPATASSSALNSFSSFASRQALQGRAPMRKVLELKWPRVCACLRYLKSLKEGAVASLGAAQERADLASAVNETLRKSAYNVLRYANSTRAFSSSNGSMRVLIKIFVSECGALSPKSFFRPLMPPPVATANTKWELLREMHAREKAWSAEELVCTAQGGTPAPRKSWGVLGARRSDGFTAPIKRELF